jgi:hypothetical protein
MRSTPFIVRVGCAPADWGGLEVIGRKGDYAAVASLTRRLAVHQT